MKFLRTHSFLAILVIMIIGECTLAQAQTASPTPDPVLSGELSDEYFTHEMLNDEEWSDAKLFPSINPKSRPTTDPTATEDYLKLPWYQRKLQVAQLLWGIVQYRIIGIFHHQPSYYARMYRKWTEKTPQKFSYLKIFEDRRTPKIENSLTFINSKYEYRGISDKAIGYCYGVSTLFKKFTQRAFFSETIVNEDQVPARGSDEWYKYYIERMAKVISGEAAFFPGFKNLRELTTVPEFEFYLKVQVTKEWKRMATLKSTLRDYPGNTKEMNAESVAKLVQNLKDRLARGEFPKISFASAISKTFLTGGARTHVVLANRVEELPSERTVRIHIWDINFYGEDLVKRPYFIEVKYDESGVPEIRYREWANPSHDTKKKFLRTELPGDRIGQVIIVRENNRETVETIDALEEFCEKPPVNHPEIKSLCDRAQSSEVNSR